MTKVIKQYAGEMNDKYQGSQESRPAVGTE